ncbi:DNA polymerase II large subunit [archaeon]|jgi:DNA polymerase II large subunit|nr:DNA polymerase II large subunit [archaeon]MBT7128983.1 DNA polymerase II large subunit [archaeon]
MGDLDDYFKELKRNVDLAYGVANEARAKGLDPEDFIECPLALTMAERAVNLIKTVYPKLDVGKISGRILELEEKYGKLDATVAFVIAREIAEEKWGKFEGKLDAIDAGIRVGFAYMTLGVVASPIEGYTGLRLGKTKSGEDYFVASFSGPIRSAGTTSVCLVLMLIDYLREYFGFAKYDINEDEVGRYVTEIGDFHERVSNLAYFPTEEEIRFLAERLPIQIDGDPTERLEVSNFKDLARVDSNRIRGGMCLAFGESLALKAEKALGRLKGVKVNGISCSGWDWLKEYVVLHKKRESGVKEVAATYIKDLVAGRPVYGHPGRSGGFRFRYGRSRTSGFSAVSVHPATMGVTGGFLSHGTQLRLEKPTKACVITGCDSIDGPIVKLKNGSVRKLEEYKEALDLYNSGEIAEIVYLGDLLFPIGDIVDRNADLIRPGYVGEWWTAAAEIASKDSMQNHGVFDPAFRVEELGCVIGFERALELSEEFGVPLHPDFIFYWTQISMDEFVGLMRWLNGSVWRGDKLVLNWESGKREEFAFGKRALEILGVRHEVVLDNVVVDLDARALLFNIGKKDIYNGEVLEFKVDEVDDRSVLEIVNGLCSVEVKDKAGTFIGARMGRPEKAKLRKLAGSPNVLFPVGDSGGRLKSIQDAIANGFVKADLSLFRCECGSEGVFERCGICGEKGKRMSFCRKCNEVKDGACELHGDVVDNWSRKVEIGECFDRAIKKLGFKDFEIPPMVKGVGRLSSEAKVPEDLTKGILRAKFGLSVNKDGTIRYDAIEIPLTHFKAREIGTSIERLRELGYLRDIDGADLVCGEQILELMPHDIVLPSCSILGNEAADKVFLNIANFVDEELDRVYGLERFYNLSSRSDLVGVEVVCMAPHNCAGVIGRIIGFGNIQGLLASPYMHAAMRRDCDGDEAAVMLLMDVLLNFSRKFLPSHRGGRQDAPLVLNARIRAGEVDDQILFFESCGKYPLSLYKAAEQGLHSSVVDIELIRDKLKMGEDGFVGNGFSHDSSDFNLGNNNGVYKSLPTMKEKVAAQMELAKRLRSVDEDDVARLVLERHFIRDIRGNLRKFAKQSFRCSSCNESFRRPPLVGVCTKCKGKLIFTISEGSVRKYFEPAMELTRDYNISGYTKESMELIGDYIERIFGKGEEQGTL